ncbi:MAG: NRPS [Bogoriella megaspora]|nr:MAG: NRPS [Bogoriella megaspora]
MESSPDAGRHDGSMRMPASDQDLYQIWSWNAAVPEAIERCVHDLIKTTAELHPSAPAIDAHDGSFTYQELDELATKLACNLLHRGLQPRSILPLIFEKSKWTAVAILGVMKAGCASVTLDVAQPESRLQSIVEQVDSRWILCSRRNRSLAARLADSATIVVDEALASSAKKLIPLPKVSPHDIVYATFTSGTTGKPKASLQSHSNACSAIHYQGRELGFNEQSRVLNFAPYSFDVAWSDVLHTLCAGGCLCVPTDNDLLNDPSAAIESFQVNLANITPSILRTIKPESSTLRTVLLSGEVPYKENITQWADRVRLLNTFGPAECTWKSTFSVIDPKEESRPPIGKGVGVCTWVVNPEDPGQLAAIGEVGELWIEGPLVGQGYLSNPEKNSEVFIENPPWLLQGGGPTYSGRTGRLYRSGDLVKYDPDGALLFCGRKDSQVKIRGQRVELGDVEYHVAHSLAGQMNVSIVAEVVSPTLLQNPLLVVFLQSQDPRELPIDQLRMLIMDIREQLETDLAERLPVFMVPSAYIAIDRIPLASTGKADRSRLREIGRNLSKEQLYILDGPKSLKPMSNIEEQLQDIWAAVLGFDHSLISVDDHFFRIGGDSVAAIKVVSRARDQGLDFTVQDIFRTPRLCNLAEVVSLREDDFQHEAVPPFSLLRSDIDPDVFRGRAAEATHVDPADIQDIFPCTTLQSGLLAITSKRADAFVSRFVYKIRPDIDIERFKTAWEGVVLQTQILRSRVIDLAGQGLVQVILNNKPQWCDEATLSQPMGLGTSLSRVAIIRDKGNGEHRFVWQIHHSLYDGHSKALILDHLEKAYAGSGLPQIVQFQTFIRRTLSTSKADISSFWNDQLARLQSSPFPTVQATVHRESNLRTPLYHSVEHHITNIEWPQSTVTPATILRSVWALLLAHYTNSSDVLFGATVSGRHAAVPGIDLIPGPTIATVPIRVLLDRNMSVQDFQTGLQTQAVDMIPFEQTGLQSISSLVKNAQRVDLVDTLLIIQAPETSEKSLQREVSLFTPGNVSLKDNDGIYNDYLVMLVVQLQAADVQLQISFDSSLVESQQIQRLMFQFEHLLRQLCTMPKDDIRVRDVTAIDQVDLHDLQNWNGNPISDLGGSPSIVEMISGTVEEQPDEKAISSWDGNFTYRELNKHAVRYASSLTELGIASDSPVIMCLEKCKWMPVLLMAILKIGAVPVPISASSAPLRARSIAQLTQAKLAVVSSSALANFIGDTVHTISIEELSEISCHAETPLSTNSLEERALLLFTSGSTGTPKGIVWNHQTMSANVKAMGHSLGLSKATRIFQFASYDFDVSIVETLAAFVYGACLCIPSEEARSNSLSESIAESQANWICVTPSVSELISPRAVTTLKTIVFAGEKLQMRTVSRWADRALFNWYGPAEASFASVCQIDPEKWHAGCIGRSSIGRTWLVDPEDANSLMPIGAIGELLVEGPLLARGYLNDSILDEAAFVTPTWMGETCGGSSEQARKGVLYKTGDLCRYLSDGSLIYVGRKDTQVKINGQRVELEEIENYIRSSFLDKLGEIAVEGIRLEDTDDNILALFMSAEHAPQNYTQVEALGTLESSIAILEELRVRLSARFPAHMIPRVCLPVRALPVSDTGKLDRRKLREIGGTLTKSTFNELQATRSQPQPPSSDMEKRLQQLWAAVLGIDPSTIDANDNFLSIGGDSVQAMRLVARAREQAIKLTVADVFQNPQLCELANVTSYDLDRLERHDPVPFSLLGNHTDILSIRAEAARLCQVKDANSIEDIYPCTPLQKGLLAMTVKTPGVYVSRSVLPLQEEIDEARLRRAWEALVQQAPILRTRIIDLPGRGLVQVVLNDTEWREGNEIGAYAETDKKDEMSLGTPLCRATLLEDLYFKATGTDVYANSLFSFASFVDYSVGIDQESAENFWNHQLSGSEAAMFPLLPSPNYQPIADDFVEHSIPDLAWPRTGITASTIIRAAFAYLIGHHTNSRNDVVFGATVSGRQAPVPGIELIPGPTIATVPIRVQIPNEDMTLAKLLEDVQRQAAEMITHEQLGLQRIRQLSADNPASHFQTLLVVQPASQGKSLLKDNKLFKARLASELDAHDLRRFNTYALMITAELEESGLQVQFSFDSRAITNWQINHLANQFERIIRQICLVDTNKTSLAQLEVTSKHDLSYIWSLNSFPPRLLGPELSVIALFTRIAGQQSDAVGVRASDGNFTFRELDELSSRLACGLSRRGADHGSPILIHMEKSKWVTVAILGVLRAGGVSFLQDSAVPPGRIQTVLHATQSKIALISASKRTAVEQYVSCFTVSEVMAIDASDTESSPELCLDEPAALLSSSGSTGEPKVFLWSHRALLANVQSHGEVFNVNSESRVFQFCSYNFDLAIVETLSALVHGGCICVPNETQRTESLTDVINKFECDSWCFTPTLARMLDPKTVPSLKLLVFAGENSLQEDIDRWKGDRIIKSWYGPAEACAASFCTMDEHWRSGMIGRKGPASCCWVVDPEDPNRLSPVGAIGELVIEGPIISERYIGSRGESLTAQSFLQDLDWMVRGTSAHSGRHSRVYKTGDLVQYAANGHLIYLGRKDSQVKLRGQRIELGEVEYQTRRHLSGMDVVAEVIVPQDGSRTLVVFVQAKDNELSQRMRGLETSLADSLPVYMVPSAFIPVAKIPMTSTGKVDRRRLREQGASMTLAQLAQLSQNETQERRLISTPSEKALQQLWSEILGIDPETVSADDSFFRVGDSIHAMRLVGLARQKGLILTVADMFKAPRFCDMATRLENTSIGAGDEEIAPFSLLKPDDDIDSACVYAARSCQVNKEQIEDIYPCTALQEGLIAMTTKRQDDYIGRSFFELSSHLDKDRFKDSWKLVVSKLAILRTRIVDLPEREQLYQVVVDDAAQWISSESMEDYVLKDKNLLMGLGTTLTRYGLFKDGNRIVFALTMHHSMYDGQTSHIILDMVEQIYGRKNVTELLPFPRFIRAASEQLTESSAGAFWSDHFSGLEAAPFPPLPSATYQPHATEFIKSRIEHSGTPVGGVTLSTAIRGAWGTVISRWTQSSDSVFGVVVSGRNAPVAGIETVVGPTIATVPVRTTIEKFMTVQHFLQQVQKQATDMIPFEQTGLQRIKRASEEASLACQFQTLLVVQPPHYDKYSGDVFLREIRCGEPNDRLAGFSTYAVVLICEPDNGGVNVSVSFDSNAVPREQAHSIMNQFTCLLEQLCSHENDNSRLCDLQSMNSTELAELWSRNANPFQPVEECVHEMISEVAKQHPGRVAISAWDGEMTYGELDSLSTVFAGHLVDLGVRRGAIVPLCIEKSMWMSVAMLAVMKAGAASVALDCTQPVSRLSQICEQVDSEIIISSSQNVDLSIQLRPNVILLSCDTFNKLDEPRSVKALPKVDPSDTLFLVFTSGSTGIPKGVLCTHRNFCSAIVYQRGILQFNQNTRLFDFSSYAWDAAWWNLLHVLGNGATLVVPSENERKNELEIAITRFRASHIFLTPATARTIRPDKAPTLQTIYFGGEAVTKQDLQPWMSRNPHILYGPSETTIMTMGWKVPDDVSNLSIGKGQGACAWVIDLMSENQLAPQGVIGELYLESPLVGPGYLRDVEKTSAAFSEDPAWLLRGAPGVPGRRGRVYKTGDLVRQTTDGNLTFVGRRDAQVKLRGQRVELGEIEHHIRDSLTSRGAQMNIVATVISPRGSTNAMLVAFIEGNGMSGRLWNEVVTDLSVTLPSYTVPYGYLALDSLPTNVARKYDRRRLQEIGASTPLERLMWADDCDRDIVLPSNDMERKLQRIWASVLSIVDPSTISTKDSFLRLGGDSVGAMRLVSMAREQGLTLTVADILSTPRLDLMAEAATRPSPRKSNAVTPFSLLRSIVDEDTIRQQVGRICQVDSSVVEDVFPCTAVQQSLMAVTAKHSGDYIARFEIQLREHTNLLRLRRAWESTTSAIPLLRTRIVNLPDHGIVQAHINVPLKWLASDSTESFIKQDEEEPMGLGSPLSKLGIVQNPTTKTISLIWSLHHAIYDGFVTSLILQEVEKAYKKQGHEVYAPFQAFIQHLIEVDQAKALEFWQDQLIGSQAIPFPILPEPDFHCRANSTVLHDISNLKWPRNDTTASAVMRAAWSIISARYTESNDVVFGAVVSGRQVAVDGIESIPGPTIAAVPVRIVLDTQQTVSQTLRDIHNQAIHMIDYEHFDLRSNQLKDTEIARASNYNTLLVIQPQKHGVAGTDFNAEGPFERSKDLATLSSGLDTFNPHPVMVICQLLETGVRLEVSFDSRIVERPQMRRIVNQLEHVIRQLCDSDSADTMTIAQISVASEQDLHDIWTRNAQVPKPYNRCVHNLIAETTNRQPQAPAICAWDGELTYGELDAFSDNLAHHLVRPEIDLRPNSVVPLCLAKSMWIPIAVLGVMKAGGACVTMDVTQPEGRLRTIVEHIRPNLILTSAENEDLAYQIVQGTAKVLVVDRPFTDKVSPELPLPIVKPSDPLYVVFTSGSTGVPKGVVTLHRNFASAELHQSVALHVNQDSRVFDFVSCAFDVYWSNLLHTLIQGACLCIPSEWERKNDIPGAISRLNANYTYFTPSVARALEPSTMPTIKTLNMGGESISRDDYMRWPQVHTAIGEYGPAECAQLFSVVELTGSTVNGDVGVPYGTIGWLVEPDRPDHLAAIGTVGELWIEGPPVSAGYFKDPERTWSSFVEDPPWLLQGVPGVPGRHGRLYKTGDLLRQLDDGTLMFVGRKDTQVKIRGQRVEMGEIEQNMLTYLRGIRHSGIAAEIIKPADNPVPMLVAFIGRKKDSANHEEAENESAQFMKGLREVEERLTERLPIYMIPTAYIPIDKIPMTATGKTDRRRLREIGHEYTREQLAALHPTSGNRREPATEMELLVQRLWASILGHDAQNISAVDSFLRIGGDSIAAMRLVSVARDHGLALTVADIFKSPKLCDLAASLESGERSFGQDIIRTVQPFELLKTDNVDDFLKTHVYPQIDADPSTIEDVLPVTDFQTQAIEDALCDPPGRWPHWIVNLPFDVDFAKLTAACHQLIQELDVLRVIFIEAQDVFCQVFVSNLEPCVDHYGCSEDAWSVAEKICGEDLKNPRKLGKSWVRFMTIKDTNGEHKLLVRLPHTQFDGYSFQSMLERLASTYNGNKDRPSPAAFKQFIAHQSSGREASLQYWRTRLYGSLPPTWNRETTVPQTPQTYTPSDRLIFSHTIRLPQPRAGISTATLFHAACALVLAQHTPHRTLIFGRLVTGRSMLPSSLQSVIGPCITEVPIHLTLPLPSDLLSIATKLQEQFIEDSRYEAAGMRDIIRHATEWGDGVVDFGWRTAFQQEEGGGFVFAGERESEVRVWDREVLPRSRPEVYATPKGGELVLEFEGNGRLVEEEMVRGVVEEIGRVLEEC